MIKPLQRVVEQLDTPLFHKIGEAADSIGRPCYAVGGCVRDLFLDREAAISAPHRSRVSATATPRGSNSNS